MAIDHIQMAGVAGRQGRTGDRRLAGPRLGIAGRSPGVVGDPIGLDGAGAARPQVGAGLDVDQGLPLVVVVVAQQRFDRHVDEPRVAVIGLAVGKGELGRLGDDVDEAGAERIHGAQVEAPEQGKLLQEHRPLAPRTGLAHDQVAVRVCHRLLIGRLPVDHVVTGQQAAMGAAAAVHDLAPAEAVDLLGDEALVPHAPRRLDDGLAR